MFVFSDLFESVDFIVMVIEDEKEVSRRLCRLLYYLCVEVFCWIVMMLLENFFLLLMIL